jgi:HTH-type transcriptional regulator/antitoxin HigA
MEIRPIRTEADYKSALKEVSELMQTDPELGTPEGDRLDVLVTLIEAYERRHYPIAPPDPIEAIKFRMEQQGLTVADMDPYIGPPHRVYEVLARKRRLSLTMIRRLHAGLGMPADTLISEPVP